jgi:undecaprenyl-diphosphatase
MNDGTRSTKGGFYSTRTVMLVIVLLAVCVLLTFLLSFREITDLDVWLFQEAREQYETGFKSFMRVFTELGSLTFWFLVVPLLWIARKKKEAASLLVAILIVIVFAVSMKYAIDRPRPYEVMQAVDPLYRPIDPSFPSAHAMTVFAAAVTIGKKWRKALIPLLFLAAAVGFSRVYIGVHYPYDVASGALIGILIGLGADSLDLSRMIRWIDNAIYRLANRLLTSDEQ